MSMNAPASAADDGGLPFPGAGRGPRADLWSAIAAPLPAAAISWRQDGKPITRDGRHFARFVCYVEANTVRERLDAVVPGEWDLTLDLLPPVAGAPEEAVAAFKARLQILGVIREDVGSGKDYKQAATDAFKRAAVRFGLAHELYAAEQNWVEMDGDGKYAKPVEDPGQAYARRHGALGAGAPAGQAPVRTQEERPRAKPAAELTRPANGADPYGVETGAPPQAANTPEAASGEAARPRSAAGDSSTAGGAGAAGDPRDEVSCPKCGGRMWDNRLTKRNPKAPDYKCRTRTCDGVVWPPKDGKDTPAAAEQSSRRPRDTHAGRGAQEDLVDDLPF